MPSSNSFSGAVLVDSIQSFMDVMESRYRRSFLALIESVSNSPELITLVKEATSGSMIEMSSTVYNSIENITIDTSTLRNLARQAMSGGGRVTAKAVGLEGRFDITNPRAIAYARSMSSELITGITRTARENIREILADAVEGEAGTAETVRRIKAEVGLTKRDSSAVRNYRKQLRVSGRSVKDANTMAQKYAEKLLRKRAQTIARTEIAQATNFGQHEFWRQMQDSGDLPQNTMRMWITWVDEKTCPICGPMNGELTTIDGSWMTGNGPLEDAHAHPNCRCTSGLVFPTKLKKNDPLGWEHWVVSKGEGPGHPFRGNQWTKTKGTSSGVVGSDANDAFWKSMDSQQAILSDSEKIALDRYTGNGYDETNSYLRGTLEARNANMTLMERGLRGGRDFSAEDAKKSVGDLDTIFEKTSVTVSQDVVLHRGMTANTSKASETWAAKLKVGDVVEDLGFVSTSHVEESARRFATSGVSAGIVFNIKAKSGTKMMAANEQESELVLNRGSKMMVNSVSVNGKIVTVEAELV